MATRHLWRQSSSLILILRNPDISCPNFQVLTAKRSSKSKFMPNAHVFPGGVTETNDFAPQWNQVLEKVAPVGDLVLKNAPRPRILTECNRLVDNALPGDIGLRINAIRETFEETGVLLHKPVETLPNQDDLNKWRTTLNNDGAKFLDMCLACDIVPDVWALHEWSDWLTPVGLGQQRRFDTIFYIGFPDHLNSDVTTDNYEISQIDWSSPKNLLDLNRTGKIWLAPPQVYELSRLATFSNYDELKSFSIKRSSRGIETWLPLMLQLADGKVSVYPQDDFYPNNPDFEGTTGNPYEELKNMTIEEFSSMHSRKNRMEMRSLHDSRLSVNVEDQHGHRLPVQEECKRSKI